VRKVVFMSAILLGVTFPVAADQAVVNPQANARLGALRSAQPANPYEKLFQARESLKQALDQQTAKPAPKTKIVCGMMVVEADPSLDPRMAVTPPQDPKLSYAIRVFEPPVCK
jgi:hypothetical protein